MKRQHFCLSFFILLILQIVMVAIITGCGGEFGRGLSQAWDDAVEALTPTWGEPEPGAVPTPRTEPAKPAEPAGQCDPDADTRPGGNGRCHETDLEGDPDLAFRDERTAMESTRYFPVPSGIPEWAEFREDE